MALYEFNDEQVRVLKAIIQNAQIRVKDAPPVYDIMNALSKPIERENEKTVGKEDV